MMPTGMARLALVTGATGFMARHLIPDLVEEGWEVRASGRRARPGWLPPDSCVLADVPLGTETARVVGALSVQPTASWRLEAVPVATMGPEIHFVLAESTSTTRSVPPSTPSSPRLSRTRGKMDSRRNASA